MIRIESDVMTLESFISKLTQNIETAKNTLRNQLLKKVNNLATQLENFSPVEVQEELENLVDDFLDQFSDVYQRVISYVEEEIPTVPKTELKPAKKRVQKPKSDEQRQKFVRPTYVHQAFTEEGLRVSKDARPKIIEILNKKIKEDIEAIKSQIPTFTKGEKSGEKKRITIKPEDISEEKLKKATPMELGKEIDTIMLEDLNGQTYELRIFVRIVD